MRDLFLLAADKNMEFALRGALSRPEALGIRPVDWQIRVHPDRDGGMRTSGVQILNLERRAFSHALMVFDWEGCGASESTPEELEHRLDERLQARWRSAAKAIMIEPELDVWMWGADNALQEVFQWPESSGIRAWLIQEGFEFGPNDKPIRPKEAMEALRPVHRAPRSSALYEKIAQKISLRRCGDPAFGRLRSVLTRWFPLG